MLGRGARLSSGSAGAGDQLDGSSSHTPVSSWALLWVTASDNFNCSCRQLDSAEGRDWGGMVVCTWLACLDVAGGGGVMAAAVWPHSLSGGGLCVKFNFTCIRVRIRKRFFC